MKILFITEKRINAGSIQAVAGYMAAAERLGHTIALYGATDPAFPKLRFSTEPDRFDFAVFILESQLDWLSGLRTARILAKVPRERRVVLDADGMYNERISAADYDRNHANIGEQERWREACEQYGAKIFQPTLTPRHPRVRSLLFYGYAPEAEDRRETQQSKALDVVHVCHNWWRWRELESRFFPVIRRIRDHIGEISFVGLWWDASPDWAGALGLQDAFRVDADRLKQLQIGVRPPVPFTQVVRVMSSAKVNLMTQRPLFQQLGIITSKYFEVLCADTIPLLLIDPDLAESIYGPAGKLLALNGCVEQRLLTALECPEAYRVAVEQARTHLREHHSYERRVHQLVKALES